MLLGPFAELLSPERPHYQMGCTGDESKLDLSKRSLCYVNSACLKAATKRPKKSRARPRKFVEHEIDQLRLLHIVPNPSFHKLQVLDLSNNKLRSLSVAARDLGCLPRLKYLDLRLNQLTSVDDVIRVLEKCNELVQGMAWP